MASPTELLNQFDQNVRGGLTNAADVFGNPQLAGKGAQMRAQAGLIGSEQKERDIKNQAAIAINQIGNQPDFLVTDAQYGTSVINPKYAGRFATLQAIHSGNYTSNILGDSNHLADQKFGVSNKEIKVSDGESIIPGMSDLRYPQGGTVQGQPGVVASSTAAKNNADAAAVQQGTQIKGAIASGNPGLYRDPNNGRATMTSPQMVGNLLANGAAPEGVMKAASGAPTTLGDTQSIVPSSAPPFQGQQSAQSEGPVSILPQGVTNSQFGQQPGAGVGVAYQPGGQPVIRGGNIKAIGGLTDELSGITANQAKLRGILDQNHLASSNNPYTRGTFMNTLNHLTFGLPDQYAAGKEESLIGKSDPGAQARLDREAARIGELGASAKNLTSRVTEKEIGLLSGALPSKGAGEMVWKQHLARTLAADQYHEALIRASIQNGGYPLRDEDHQALLANAFKANGLDEHGNMVQGGPQTPSQQGPQSLVPQNGQQQSQPSQGGIPEGSTASGPNGKIIFKGGQWQPLK